MSAFRIRFCGVCGLPRNCDGCGCRQRPTIQAEEQEDEPASLRFNLAGPTLGGMQFWTDELIFREWRIQRHSWTSHYRLLDDRDVRRAWGTFEQCRQRWEELRREQQMEPLKPTVIVVLHGLGRTRSSMDSLCSYLRSHSDFDVLSMGYASTREGISDHAAALAKVIQHLEGVQRVHLVAHSMGNIVIRRYLARSAAEGNSDSRLGRIVMLAPPNNGAQIASRLRENKLFQLVMGASGTELGQSPEEFERELATPSCQFGIIAGGTGDDQGYSPLLAGDDDLLVTVAETRLPARRTSCWFTVSIRCFSNSRRSTSTRCVFCSKAILLPTRSAARSRRRANRRTFSRDFPEVKRTHSFVYFLRLCGTGSASVVALRGLLVWAAPLTSRVIEIGLEIV